jgi:hypothetical protein
MTVATNQKLGADSSTQLAHGTRLQYGCEL